MPRRIIGLGYKARSGKDTIGEYLGQSRGYIPVAFATALKEAVMNLFGFVPEQVYGSMKEKEDPFWHDTPRRILQLVGTECMRHGYRDDFWIKVLERRVVEDAGWACCYAVTDVRFPNEAMAIQSWGGKVYRVDRPEQAISGIPGHASETAMDHWDGWDGVINNSGTLEDLYKEVDRVLFHERHQKR